MNKRLAIFGVICLAIVVFVIGFAGSKPAEDTYLFNDFYFTQLDFQQKKNKVTVSAKVQNNSSKKCELLYVKYRLNDYDDNLATIKNINQGATSEMNDDNYLLDDDDVEEFEITSAECVDGKPVTHAECFGVGMLDDLNYKYTVNSNGIVTDIVSTLTFLNDTSAKVDEWENKLKNECSTEENCTVERYDKMVKQTHKYKCTADESICAWSATKERDEKNGMICTEYYD